MSPETLALVKSIIPVISAILGTVVGVAGTIFVTLINKRSEEKKHLNSLSFNAGIANFEQAIKTAIAQKGRVSVLPLDLFILNMKYLSDIIQKKNIGKEDLKKLVLEKQQIVEDLAAALEESTKKAQESTKADEPDGGK